MPARKPQRFQADTMVGKYYTKKMPAQKPQLFGSGLRFALSVNPGQSPRLSSPLLQAAKNFSDCRQKRLPLFNFQRCSWLNNLFLNIIIGYFTNLSCVY